MPQQEIDVSDKTTVKLETIPLWRHITLGNVLNLCAVIILGTGFFWKTTFVLDNHETRLNQQDVKIAGLTAAMAEKDKDTNVFRDRLSRDMQIQSQRDSATDLKIIERLTAVETEIRGLRSDINRLDRFPGGGKL